MPEALKIHISRYDILDRIAARYDLSFTLNELTRTVDERNKYGVRETRDATVPELQMWAAIIPEPLRQQVNSIWQTLSNDLLLPATPEEVWSNVLYNDLTYLCAEDFCALRGLPCFVPNLNRETLKDGLVGAVDGLWKVCVSRRVPQGYYHQPERGSFRTELLHPWRPAERGVRPEPTEGVHFESLKVQQNRGFSDMIKTPAKTA